MQGRKKRVSRFRVSRLFREKETWDVLLGSVLVGLEFLPGKSNHIFESENFRFPSSTKDSITWGVKCQKLRFRKS